MLLCTCKLKQSWKISVVYQAFLMKHFNKQIFHTSTAQLCNCIAFTLKDPNIKKSGPNFQRSWDWRLLPDHLLFKSGKRPCFHCLIFLETVEVSMASNASYQRNLLLPQDGKKGMRSSSCRTNNECKTIKKKFLTVANNQNKYNEQQDLFANKQKWKGRESQKMHFD